MIDRALYRIDGALLMIDGALYWIDGALRMIDRALYWIDGALLMIDRALYRIDGALLMIDGARGYEGQRAASAQAAVFLRDLLSPLAWRSLVMETTHPSAGSPRLLAPDLALPARIETATFALG